MHRIIIEIDGDDGPHDDERRREEDEEERDFQEAHLRIYEGVPWEIPTVRIPRR